MGSVYFVCSVWLVGFIYTVLGVVPVSFLSLFLFYLFILLIFFLSLQLFLFVSSYGYTRIIDLFLSFFCVNNVFSYILSGFWFLVQSFFRGC